MKNFITLKVVFAVIFLMCLSVSAQPGSFEEAAIAYFRCLIDCIAENGLDPETVYVCVGLCSGTIHATPNLSLSFPGSPAPQPSLVDNTFEVDDINPEVSSQQIIDEANPRTEDRNIDNEMVEDQNGSDCIINNKRRKTSVVWNDFEVVVLPEVGMKAVCNHCKYKFAYGGRGSSTSHLKRHLKICLPKKLSMKDCKKQSTISFQPQVSSVNPFMEAGTRYSNEKMREIIATSIMVHEYPFSIVVVEDEAWMWAFQYANSDFQKVTRKTIRNDCLTIYEAEKKCLKCLLKNVSKISLTTDMWKSSHQIVEYMVITGHFIDEEWKLQKRVLSFVKVPAPRRGIDVADAIFKCLKAWGIENKVFSVTVDNASYNDSCVRALKQNLSLTRKLALNGDLLHVRCCAHILNLLVQDGLDKIKLIIQNVRESVKYINHNDARLKVFSDILEQKGLKETRLIIDCPTRWNSTFSMLSTALKFRIAFPAYKEREPHYKYSPSEEEWDQVEKVCKFLEVFNLATHVISGSEYITANLYLPEVWRVKEVIDKALLDENIFMNEMAAKMKEKFDKYWGQCNLLMAIASVLDPRFKFHVVSICFPLIYKPESVAQENIDHVMINLQVLYNEYVEWNKEEMDGQGTDLSGFRGDENTSNVSNSSLVTGSDQILNMVRKKQAIPPLKSELQAYLDDDVYIPDSNSFNVLEWWKNHSVKYKILSRMAVDILAIPISTVASESTFSAGGRVIDDYRSKLKEDSIEALICGGDWLRRKYNMKKKKVVRQEDEIIKKT